MDKLFIYIFVPQNKDNKFVFPVTLEYILFENTDGF